MSKAVHMDQGQADRYLEPTTVSDDIKLADNKDVWYSRQTGRETKIFLKGVQPAYMVDKSKSCK
jgi:hypothetical protein